MTFIVVCTGTAGHINPGISIAEEIRSRKPETKIVFIGAGRELERKLVPGAGFELINIKMSGIKRSFKLSSIIHNIKTLYNVMSSKGKVKKILKSINPDAVIGTGGYVCYPVLKEAAKMKIPTFIHESNAQPGMTVKMLSGIVDKVMITFSGYEEQYKFPERLVLTGCPLRKDFYKILDGEKDNNNKEKPLVVSFWGSLGSEKMNELMATFIKRNIEEENFFHIHAAGNSRDVLTKNLTDLGITKTEQPYADIRDYINDMPSVMKKADLVLCRAGAITLSELTALGKPSILVPSPYVPDNVQTINAKQLEDIGGAKMIKEIECTGNTLYESTLQILSDRIRLTEMSEALLKLSSPNATSDIVDLIFNNTRE